ncbi:MAG: methionine--tRNA ligase, partial [Rhodospirillaceae bacterium]|nr:methionine--tRNA ligase [Rhodospirillaceae bacterium]
MTDKPRYYITTAIAYVNGLPHLGHAYEVIATDVMARFKRLDGFDVYFVTGTDEHGQKVAKSAADSGKEPREFTDEISAYFKEMDELLNVSFDRFIRTTEEAHYTSSQAIWQRIADAGDIYLGGYAGWYSTRDEAFFDEGELTDGEGGKKLAPSGAECEWVEEPSYFFKLSEYTQPLLDYYEKNPGFIQPDFRRNEVVNFVKQGLRDLSISRTTFDWGVPVPGDPDHIMYVWLDALTNYITAAGFPDERAENWDYWPADLHVIGKDIVRFHAVYWPAFLMSAGIPLPKRVYGHGFLNVEGAKMSKSLGNVLSPKDMVDEFGLDQLRYFLLREVPFGNDGSFSREQIINRINSDLANDLGNLAQRVLSMISKNCDAKIPDPGDEGPDSGLAVYSALSGAQALRDKLRAHAERQAFHDILEEVWKVIREANRCVDEDAPWALRKTDPAKMATVLYVLAETIRHVAILLQPFMPDSCGRMLDQLSVAE